ncbi:MAG: aspartate aminotransferase family protein [Victivallales bacterium]|nr:aspartate aminotransferase family protein [Victivallales bacterium]
MSNNYTNIFELQKKYVMPTYAPSKLLVRGQGSYVWDDQDKRHLDFGSGISVCNIGHCNPAVSAAICSQVNKLVHVSNLYINENQPRLAEKLISRCFDGVVFFANSGAEANEGMIKLARKWGSDKGRHEIITMQDSFHGRTLATLAATGRDKYRKGFSPDMPGFSHVPFNDIQALKDAVSDKTAAIMLEPVQGEGGILPASVDYIRAVRELCDEQGILLMFDEVQCGMGRTGKFFAFQNYGVEPDVVSSAKALGNGFPIGAFIVKRKYAEVLQPGTHASTFGGTPLACAAACAVIDYIEDHKVLENCIEQGKYITAELNKFKDKYSFIQGVRGLGLMIGIVLDRSAMEIIPALMEKGLIALPAGETVLRLLPPLTVSKAEVDEALKIMQEVFDGLA